MKSLEELLAPVSDDAPSGEDMDESIEFDRLRDAFDQNFKYDARVLELEEGESGPDSVDWRELRESIEELSGKTKDLYLAVAYARCGFPMRDPELVQRGLEFAAALLEDQWETLNPNPFAEDSDYSESSRPLICEDLADRGGFGIPLHELPIINEDRFQVTGGQLWEADEHGAASDSFPAVMGAFDQLEDDRKKEISEMLDSYASSIDRIEAALKEKGEGEVPDFGTTRDYLGMVRTAFGNLSGLGGSDGDEGAEDGDGALGDAGIGSDGKAFGGAVQSRDDVIKALNAIEQYYSRAEPGHPVKVALARLRGWVHKDFIDILKDIAPGSVPEAESVLIERQDVE